MLRLQYQVCDMMQYEWWPSVRVYESRCEDSGNNEIDGLQRPELCPNPLRQLYPCRLLVQKLLAV